jgi:hypothetical protein
LVGTVFVLQIRIPQSEIRNLPRPRQRLGDLEQQGALADARLAADEDGGPGDDAAAEDAVELPDPGRPPGGVGLVDLGERERLAGRREVAGLPAADHAPGGPLGRVLVGRRGLVLLQRVPRAAVRALAHPLRVDRAAVVAEELGARLSHVRLILGQGVGKARAGNRENDTGVNATSKGCADVEPASPNGATQRSERSSSPDTLCRPLWGEGVYIVRLPWAHRG